MAKKKDEPLEVAPVVEVETVIPNYGDIGWSDYIMSQFEADEIFEGSPTADGLRRVCNKFLGRIIESDVQLISEPSPTNGFTAFVKATIVVNWLNKLDNMGYPLEMKFSDLADANSGNVSDPLYGKYLTAVCATRAEARALRKALLLKKIVAMEELDTSFKEPDFITVSQFAAMNTIGQRADIDILKVLNSGESKYTNLKEITYKKAQAMLAHLNALQQDPAKIKEFKGYKKDWNNG